MHFSGSKNVPHVTWCFKKKRETQWLTSRKVATFNFLKFINGQKPEETKLFALYQNKIVF